MTRTIKAKDILPGMTIRWGQGDITHQCPIAGVERFNNDQDVQGETPQGQAVLLHGDEDVLVVKEPPQPEEPTEFGARVRVRDGRFVRLSDGDLRYRVWHEEGTGCQWTWGHLCEMGHVQVIPDQGWEVPTGTQEASGRINKWDSWEDVPEGVVVTNPGLLYHYRKAGGKIEALAPADGAEWFEMNVFMESQPGPWIRDDDALESQESEAPERLGEWPENDTALREHKWLDRDHDIWSWVKTQGKWECRTREGRHLLTRNCPPFWFAPFTRIVDA